MDRPGIGGSDFISARALYERAVLAEPLADHLGIGRFAVLGWSAGGAYALACAHRLAGRVTATGIACGFAPFDRPAALDGMDREMRRMIPMVKRLPFLLGLFMSLTARQYRKDPRKAFDKQFASGVSEADRAVMARPAIGENLLAGAREAMSRGGAGPALELKLQFGRPWGFRLEDIQTPVRLWYGDADGIVPVQMGRYLEQAIPNARLITCEGEGHMLFYTRWEEMLTELVSA